MVVCTAIVDSIGHPPVRKVAGGRVGMVVHVRIKHAGHPGTHAEGHVGPAVGSELVEEVQAVVRIEATKKGTWIEGIEVSCPRIGPGTDGIVVAAAADQAGTVTGTGNIAKEATYRIFLLSNLSIGVHTNTIHTHTHTHKFKKSQTQMKTF